MSDLVFATEVGPITFHGTDILRIVNNHVVEYWLNADTLDLMTQLQVGAS